MFWITAHLYIREGRETEFREYEDQALAIFREYGEVIARYRPADGPHEIHVLRTPTEEAFTAFRADSRLILLAKQRQIAIERTEITMGSEVGY